jgi:hypothetical protein
MFYNSGLRQNLQLLHHRVLLLSRVSRYLTPPLLVLVNGLRGDSMCARDRFELIESVPNVA